MAKEQPLSNDLKKILEIIERQSQGAKISDIERTLPGHFSRRTLLRRLAELKQQKKIISEGKKSSMRYFVNLEKESLPLSQEGELIKELVRRPLNLRKPVAYRRDFLNSYRPNKTYYLSEVIREHLKVVGQPFNYELAPGTFIKRIIHKLLIDLSWNSSRLEGNTYSLLETERLIEFGAATAGKNALEAQMILNHKEAISFMVDQIENIGFDRYSVLSIHALLSDNLLANPKARGYLRQIPVGIGGTTYHPPEIPQLIDESFGTILEKASKIKDPFEQSFFAMVQLPYLQPFEDVNKRVSRLVANIPLIKNNLSPLSFVDVTQEDYVSGLLAVYELNRIELLREVYVWAYERSAQHYRVVQDTLGDPDLFRMRFRNELHELVHLIVSQNIRGKNILDVIQKWANDNIPKSDQESFSRIVEREITSLHAGNIAIYRLSPEVFAKWKIK